MIAGRYVIEKTLGEGTFGKVAKCQDRKKKCTVALKIIKNIERSYTKPKCNFVVAPFLTISRFEKSLENWLKWSKMVKSRLKID